ncbi:MAG: NAD(P)H-dependent glycerol-3-phosphate dehydrogenase [Oculatellaceae cyanobacterium Prado106]|jgi:glycerol-3-phosphate dehydrogenase (NAD(P)+)|nr:NAD(P)H-dependent glycerol-3-phosphate dehydrogenase [Oculatellaceae cyanobacterium Prado106]
MSSYNVTILGAGAWGSVLATLAEQVGHSVQVWSRRGELGLAEAIAQADVIVSAVSMKGVVELAGRVRSLSIPSHTILVSATKGLDPESRRTPAQIWQMTFPEHPVVVLSGPNLSQEIEQGLPTATVVASIDPVAAAQVQGIFACDRFRVYTNADPLGTELGGTLKNVIAIAAGVCDGLNLGTNAKSALVTRSLAEVIRIGTQLGAQPETFFGLSGLGDLLATCSSALSRNYRVGYGLAQGKSLEQMLQEIQGTAEGVSTTNVLIDLAERQGILVPVSWQVYQLLNQKISPQQAVEALMERDLKSEIHSIAPSD